MNERELLAFIRTIFPSRRASVGIGDDGAVIGNLVFATDMLVENVDFTRDTPLVFVARKSLAVNLSDLAAMGAHPEFVLLSLAIPEWSRAGMKPFLEAFAAATAHSGVEVVGGDLSAGGELNVSITACGRLESRPLLRSGARPGERIYLSRPIGAAAAGLSLLQKGFRVDERGQVDSTGELSYVEREFAASAIRRQVDPEAETELGPQLAALAEVSSCIDISDGLSTDLQRLCSASGCGAEIEQARLPLFPDLLAHGPRLGIDVRRSVLHGGEEYALLFTSSLRESELSSRLGRAVYAIGRMTFGSEIKLRETSGALTPLQPEGWDHFSE